MWLVLKGVHPRRRLRSTHGDHRHGSLHVVNIVVHIIDRRGRCNRCFNSIIIDIRDTVVRDDTARNSCLIRGDHICASLLEGKCIHEVDIRDTSCGRQRLDKYIPELIAELARYLDDVSLELGYVFE